MNPESCESIRDFPAWQEACDSHAQAWAAQAAVADTIKHSPVSAALVGQCVLCGRAVRFLFPRDVPPDSVSFRESLECSHCHTNARQRAAAHALIDALGERGGQAYLTEQASALYLALRKRLPGIVGSEYAMSWKQKLRLSAWLLRHGAPPLVRREDVTRLSFGDAGLDAVLSLEVLEHVPDFRAALCEFARVLKPGGVLVLTVPFLIERPATTALARVDGEGRIEHLQPPEYHGDPLGGGVLCYHHFGWDLLDTLRDSGFGKAEALRIWDPALGWPEPLWVLRAIRA